MRTIWILGIIVAVVGSLGMAGAVALGQTDPVVVSVIETGSGQADVAGAPGSEITMSVRLDNAAAAAGVQFDLNYPPAMLEVTSLSAGNVPPGSFNTNPTSSLSNFPDNSGSVRAVWASANASGVLSYVMVNVTFRLIGQAGDVAALTLDEVVVGDAGGDGTLPGRLDHAVNNGSIAIRSGDEIELVAVDPVTGSSRIVATIGEQVVVRYELRNAGAMAGLQFINRFDNSLVHIAGGTDDVDFSVTNLPASFELAAGVRNDLGELSIVGVLHSSTGINDVIIADVTYDISAAPLVASHEAPCTPLAFDAVTVGNGDNPPQPLPVITVDGELCLIPPDSVIVTVENISAHKSGQGGFDVIVQGPVSFDLLQIGGVEEVLGAAELETGKYTQIRLDVISVEVTLNGHNGFATVPSGVIKLIGNVPIDEGLKTIILLDFDAEKSISEKDDGGFSFKPTVKLIVRQEPLPLTNSTFSSASTQTSSSTGEVRVTDGVDLDVNLSITKTDSVDPVDAGADLTYTLTVTNNGGDPATGVSIVDTLPNGSTGFVSADAGCQYDAQSHSVTCDIGDLAAGASASRQIVVNIDIGVADQTVITNEATASSNEGDVDSSDNTASEDTTVTAEAPGPQLSIPSNIPALFGGTVTVPIEFVSNGHSIAALGFRLEFDDTCLSIDMNDSDVDGIPDGIDNLVPGAFGPIIFLQPGTTNQIGFAWSDNSPPISALPDLTLAEMHFAVGSAGCDPGTTGSIVTPITFSTNPAVSFGDPNGQDVAGTSVDGSVEIIGGIPGDCNGSGSVTAADFTAVVLEFFDGDDNNDLSDVPNGTFAGNPVGCDANESGSVTIADVTCTVLIFFGLECGVSQTTSLRLLDHPAQPSDLKAIAVKVAIWERIGSNRGRYSKIVA